MHFRIKIPTGEITRSFWFLLVTISISNTACNKKSEETAVPEEKYFPVESVKGSSSINLSDRNNWNFFLNGKEYSYEIDDTVIVATPKTDAYNLVYKTDISGSIIPIPKGYGPIVHFVSPGFYYQNTCSECPPKPNIKDQSTEEKLINADMLYGRFSGIPSGDVTGIRLTHQNALLDFDVKNTPPSSVITVKSIEPINPFREGADHYKAIVLAFSSGTAYIYIKIADSTYQKEISNRNHWKYILPNTHYKFTVRYDPDKKDVLIENLSATNWSEE